MLPVSAKKVNSLKELLASSDIISLHCGLSNETVQLINAESFESVKSGIILMNILVVTSIVLYYRSATNGVGSSFDFEKWWHTVTFDSIGLLL